MAMESIESFSSPPMKMEEVEEMPLTNKIDADLEEIEHKTHLKSLSQRQNHLESSSQIKTTNPKKIDDDVKKKKLPEIKDKVHREVRFPLFRILSLFPAIVASFFISYPLSVFFLISLINVLLSEYFLPVYIYMPENEKSTSKLLWIKSMIWLLSLALVFIAIFPCSKIWEWSFQSTVAVHLVVLLVSLFLLYAWIIDANFNICKIWLSGKDETEDPTGK